jgi:tetratricopeptide (TPR) repeat protein
MRGWHSLRELVTHRRPRVFISSAASDLSAFRAAVRSLILDDLGWEPWCCEIDGHCSDADPSQVCRNKIAESDVFVCLLAAEYGTELAHEPRSFTEWEIDLAASSRVPTLLYVQSPMSAQAAEAPMKSLVAVLRDQLVGCFSVDFTSVADLCSKVRSDLLAWHRSPATTAKLAIEQLLSDPQTRFTIQALAKGHVETLRKRKTFDPDYFRYEFEHFTNKRRADHYGDAVIDGTRLLSYLASVNPPTASDRHSLEVWSDFLLIYYNVLGVSGYLRGGVLSAVSLAKALFQLRRILGDTTGAIYAAQAVSGVLNSAGQSNSALIWNDYALYRSSGMVNPTAAWDSRGSIMRALGRHLEAVDCLNRAVLLSRDPDSVRAYMLARLAGAQRDSGDGKQGLQNLEFADNMAGERLSRVSVIREWISFAVSDHQFREAKRRAVEGLTICEKFGFERPRAHIIRSILASGHLLM